MDNENQKNNQVEPAESLQQSLLAVYHEGRFQDVVSQSRQLLEKFPKSIFLLNTLAAASVNLGEFDSAIESYAYLLKIDPDYTDAYLNLGIVLVKKGNIHAAIANYKSALSRKPGLFEVHCKLGLLQEQQGDVNAAIDSYRNAINLKSDYAEAYYNLSNALWKSGDIDGAIDGLKKVLQIIPDLIVGYFSLFQILETSNRLSELSSLLDECKTRIGDLPPNLKYYEALLRWREKNDEEALNIVSSIDVDGLPEFMLSAYFKLKGRCCDRLKRYDEAFECFYQMNAHVKSSAKYQQCNPDEYFNLRLNQLRQLNAYPFSVQDISRKVDDTYGPAFLVGFPRSGTTLLDTILRSHSSICVIEEKPMLARARRMICQDKDINRVEGLSEDEVAVAIRAYNAELERHLSEKDKEGLIIDKLPLNIFDIPVMHKLFPESRIVLAIRHPFDSILSCWMQSFGLNNAMANLLDLERIVDLYDLAMSTIKACERRYNLDIHVIRYEDIVNDLKHELIGLLSYLGMEWEEQLENYRDMALKRDRITTPSYTQVVQPLYKDSIYRWENYRKYFVKYFDKIQPWIDEYGY